MDPRAAVEYPASDVLDRKYSSSWVILEDEQGKLIQLWVDGVHQNPTGPIFISGTLNIAGKFPIYYHIESGYYLNSKGDPFLIQRQFTPHKFFKVGFSSSGWAATLLNTGTGAQGVVKIDRGLDIDLLNPPDRKPFLTRKIGIASRRYFITPSRVFFKGNQIGVRAPENKILLDNHIFKHDLINTLGKEWQVF